MTATTAPAPSGRRARKVTSSSPLKRGSRTGRIVLLTVLIVAAVLWMIPLLWAFYTSLRPTEYFFDHSYFSIGGPYNFDNYAQGLATGRTAEVLPEHDVSSRCPR